MTPTHPEPQQGLRTIDDILTQAFTDGASDTMWQGDRSVEIFQTAKKELLALFEQTLNDCLPERQDEHPIDPEDGRPVETYGYEATHNAVIDQTQANFKRRINNHE